MIKFSFILGYYLLSVLFCVGYCVTKCDLVNPCLCKINDNSQINISGLLEDVKLEYISDSDKNITYSFSGCKDHSINYTVGNITKTVKGSLISCNNTNSTTCEPLGTKEQVRYDVYGENNYQIVYDNKSIVTATVRLLCDNYETPFIKVLDVKNNLLLLGSPKVCVITENSSLSGGSIFLILLFVTTAVYFFGGALLFYCVRGATGVELIPNIEFWKNLPGLVRDGLNFLLSGCKHTSAAETYDRI